MQAVNRVTSYRTWLGHRPMSSVFRAEPEPASPEHLDLDDDPVEETTAAPGVTA